MKLEQLLAVGLLVWASPAAGKDQVVYRVEEYVETEPFPASQVDAMVEELERAVANREQAMAAALEERGYRRLGGVTFGGGRRPTDFVKSHGRQRVDTSTGGFGGWLRRKIGLEQSPDETLPTFEEHLSAMAKVQSVFVAPRGDPGLPFEVNGQRVWRAADRVAVVLHASEAQPGTDEPATVKSEPIHLTIDELLALTDPKAGDAVHEQKAAEVLRSAWRDLIGVDRGFVDHTGIEPLVVVHAVDGERRPLGKPLLTLPEELLDRTGKRSTLTPSELRSARWNRERRQFLRERIERLTKRREEAAAKAGGATDGAARKGLAGALGD